MAFINKQDTNGSKGTLLKGEFGYDDYSAGGDAGRVYIGDGSTNIALAKKSEVDAKLDSSAYNATDVLTKVKSVDGAGSGLDADLLDGQNGSYYQQALVSGTTIKTVNSSSLLGSGNISVQPTLVSGTTIKTINSSSLLGSGNISVQPTLVSGTNIKTVGGVSLLGTGDISVDASFEYSVGLLPVANSKLLADTTSTSYTKVKEILMGYSGEATVSFQIHSQYFDTYAYGRIYKNGVAVGTERSVQSTSSTTFTENITFNAGDYLQLYIKTSSSSYSAYGEEFKVLVAEPFQTIVIS